MGQNHLARLTAPKSWVIARKENRWTARPSPGPHGLNESITVNLLLKELLGVARTTKEVITILNNGYLAIDGKTRKSYKFPIGLMDVVKIGSLNGVNDVYRVLLDDMGRFHLVKISRDEEDLKLLKIKNKRMIKGKKIQLTFHDGRTLLVDKFEGDVGDSVLFNLSKKNIVELLKLEKGAFIYLISGKHVGKIRKVIEIVKGQDLQKAKVVFDENGEEIVTLVDYAFVVGKDKPVISIKSAERRIEEVSKKPEALEGEKEKKTPKKKEDKKEDIT